MQTYAIPFIIVKYNYKTQVNHRVKCEYMTTWLHVINNKNIIFKYELNLTVFLYTNNKTLLKI